MPRWSKNIMIDSSTLKKLSEDFLERQVGPEDDDESTSLGNWG